MLTLMFVRNHSDLADLNNEDLVVVDLENERKEVVSVTERSGDLDRTRNTHLVFAYLAQRDKWERPETLYDL